jgi:predicted component of viral defense system (DUF524 family)
MSEHLKELQSYITTLEKQISTLTKEKDKYEKQCFSLYDTLQHKEKMLLAIEKVLFKEKK